MAVPLWPSLLSSLLLIHSCSTQHLFPCDREFVESETKEYEGREFSFPLLPKTPTELETAGGDGAHPSNLQCVYSFVAGQGRRVKLEFDYFQLAGGSESCDIEYVDIYSELKSVETDILSASLAGRYCGSVAPQIVISLHNVLKLVFHSRSRDSSKHYRFSGRYSFIDEWDYNRGTRLSGPCNFLLEANHYKNGTIYSPTYPGTYPKNFHCSYHLRGRNGQRIRLLFRDFDIFFGGEHCPYDSVTIYDGATPASPIIRKVCGMQQRMELYSEGPNLLIHFNTTNPAKADPRGFVIEFEFSSRFVDVQQLLGGEKGVTHMRGTECDVRVTSIRESTHYIHSPKFPRMYPSNTSCSYILDGLQGDQDLEKVILSFEEFAILSDDPNQDNNGVLSADNDDVACPHAWVGLAISDSNMKAALSSTDESNFDMTLCDRVPKGSSVLGPYYSSGPRMVIQFGTDDKVKPDDLSPLGFKARIDFKTDFGILGEPMGTSNECLFRFTSPMGFFNSPRYPANYPLDTNCTYFIEGQPGQHILVHFEQFALYGEQEEDKCKDWLEIYDVFVDQEGKETLRLQERYCSDTFPGPTVSAFGAHSMRVVFSSDSSGTGNGFKALYEIRKAPAEDIPSIERNETRIDGHLRCGRRIVASESIPTGYVQSPNFPIKYNKDVHCDWEIEARSGYQILLTMVKLNIEGSMTTTSASCQKAVLRVGGAPRNEYCGTEQNFFSPLVTKNNSVRISFLTSPDKVNGLEGFSMMWTEVRQVKDMSECAGSSEYLCTYSQLCISSQLRCNGEHNCGHHDDTDEGHCELLSPPTDSPLLGCSHPLWLILTACPRYLVHPSSGSLLLLLHPPSDSTPRVHLHIIPLPPINVAVALTLLPTCQNKKISHVSLGELKQSSTDRTIVVAGIFCGGIFVFIVIFFCYLFKKKLERKKKAEQTNGRRRARQPFRSHQPKTSHHHNDKELSSPATSRFVHHDATNIIPPQTLRPITGQTFFG